MTLIEAKEKMPLPGMLLHLGLGKYAKPSCKSPLREEDNASFGIFETTAGYRWKDHGSNRGGDEVQFLADYLRIDNRKNFWLLSQLYCAIAREFTGASVSAVEPIDSALPDRSGFGAGSDDQLSALSVLRGIPVDALVWAQDRGVLVFNEDWYGTPVFGVTDQSGRVLEIRRLDGKGFDAVGDLLPRKSHAVKGTKKSWPVGVLEAQTFDSIALVEGVPDFLAAHAFIMQEQGTGATRKCAPVAMLGASTSINDEALQYFRGKVVFIYPHADESAAGLIAAQRWHLQLIQAGAKDVQIFDLTWVHSLTEGKVKDLNDFLLFKEPKLFQDNPALTKIMPGTI